MRYSVILLALLVYAAPAIAQHPEYQHFDPRPMVTADDYARAEQFLRQNTSPLVFGATVRPNWLENGRFWYQNTFQEGSEFIMVDAGRRTRERAFDHERLAEALSAAADTTYEAFDLPFSTFEFAHEGRMIVFDVGDGHFGCDIRDYVCTAGEGSSQPGDRNAVVSPDGMKAAFIRDFNLWVRDVETGRETQLTTDGIEDFGYATNNAGWTKSDRPVLLWSPDSRKLTTFQHDARGVGEMYLVTTAVGHPELEAWKYPLPEDSVIDALVGLPSPVSRPPSRWGAERRRIAAGVRVHLSRPQARGAPGRRSGDGGGAGRSGGEGRDLLRVGLQHGELALPARVQRGPLVLPA